MDGATLDIYVMSRSTDVYEHGHALPDVSLLTPFCKIDIFIEMQQIYLCLLNGLAFKKIE